MLSEEKEFTHKKTSTLSIILPVFNEAKTIETVIQSLLSKKIENLNLEIIIVESNSTDGTRNIVLQYQDVPNIRLILEKNPLGKGHAVRAGLKIASGDFILIQDADLEYDINDYEELLSPLISEKSAFVLGTRHGNNGVLKMRKFNGRALFSLFLNMGHYTFTTIINLLYRQRLKDPFTMYKVFRRDCLTDIEFTADRFEFDVELLIKLIKKGYIPIEIPVSYQSRSFEEGKKIRLILDTFLMLKMVIKLRFS